MINKNPAFNLKAVLRETGLAADTLRAWERRYGLPMPERTEGGHRLYSQYDVETIKWLIRKQTDGLSISRAVELWNEITASGTDPLADSEPSSFIYASTDSALPSFDTSTDAIRAEWLSACMNYDEVKAEQTLNKAFSMFQVEDVCIEIMQKGLAELGNLWFNNHVTVQQEHFASGLVMRRLDVLLSGLPAPTRPRKILVGCPPNEWHTFTPLLLTLFLRRRGLPVIYLGANVPADRFAETAIKVNANLVLMVSQTLVSAASLQHAAHLLTKQNVPVAFGGRIFNSQPAITDYISGYFLGNQIESATTEIEKILINDKFTKTTKPLSPEYLEALNGFNRKRVLIENTFKKNIQSLSINPEELNNSLHILGNNINAALRLGDINYLSSEIQWSKELLQAHQYPTQELSNYLKTYSNAIDEHIDGLGDLIKNWLVNYKENL